MTGSKELSPLKQKLSPEARKLAGELRTLFDGLGVSVTVCAAQLHMDRGTLSRFLSGERVPDFRVIENLLALAARRRNGTPPTQEVVSHFRTLQQDALQRGGTLQQKIVLLSELLAAADEAAAWARQREEELEGQLRTLQRQYAEMEVELRKVADDRERQKAEYAYELERHEQHAADDRRVLLDEIARLTSELEKAQQRRLAAENRTEDLERRLDQAEDEMEATEPDLPSAQDALSELAARREDGTLQDMDPDRAVEALNRMAAGWAADVLHDMSNEQAADLAGFHGHRARGRCTGIDGNTSPDGPDAP